MGPKGAGPAGGGTSAAALGRAGEYGTDDYATVNGVRLHWVSVGDGPLVVFLHGFPDFWFGWRHQLPALARAGFRAVAVDMRGYNLSGRPDGVEAYRRDALAADVAALVRHLGATSAAVVGHDWGGLVAWRVAEREPALVSRLAILNAPHPARFRELLASSRQARLSWYAGFFQLPWLPERLLRARGHAALRRLWRHEHRRPGAFGPAEEAAYVAAMSQPGAIEAALAYYRAAGRRPREAGVRRAPRVVPHPTLLVWGMRDGALVPENADGLARWVPDLRVVRVPEAAHWVMVDAPDVVNAALVEFLSPLRDTTARRV